MPETTLCITCPRCGRTSFHPTDVEKGWCGACCDYTAPVDARGARVDPRSVTIMVAAARMRRLVEGESDLTATFLDMTAGLLEVCSADGVRPGTVGHVAAHRAALSFLAVTRHLESA